MALENAIENKYTSSLNRLIHQDRLPHALLLIGPEGSEKLAAGVHLARHLLCEKNLPEGPCQQCASCNKTGKIIHPDLHFVFPVVGTKAVSDQFLAQWRSALLDHPYLSINQWLQLIGAENRQGNINKEECLNIIKKLSLKTYESRKKVMIIWMPEYLQKEGNRLLKIIEEPPANTHFILIAEQQELILNTILSRCQTVRIQAFSDKEVIEKLKIYTDTSAADLAQIARLSNGNLNEAIQLVASRVNDQATRFVEWMRKCYKGHPVELVKWTEAFATWGRESQKYFLRYALHFLREYLFLKMTGSDQIRLNEEELQTAKRMIRVLEFEQVESIVALLNDGIYAVERNANPKILSLDFSIKMNHILTQKLRYEQQLTVG